MVLGCSKKHFLDKTIHCCSLWLFKVACGLCFLKEKQPEVSSLRSAHFE